MKRFKTVHYTIHSNKIKDARGIRFAVLADLHGMEFGPDNRKLLETIHRYRPDGILIAGDMIVRNDSASLKTASSLMRSLAQQYPVYYALGNHEYKLYRTDPQENCMAARYQEYEKELKTAGIHILHNESCSLQVKREEVRELIGEPSSDSLNILLAHSPKYGETYFDWGADLILSGHYHGGIVRIGRHNGLLSPQLHPFPKFCCGDFHRKEQHMLVSAGAGEHTIPVRIHNPRELLMVDLKPNA